jgi:hypothetical protein
VRRFQQFRQVKEEEEEVEEKGKGKVKGGSRVSRVGRREV